MEIRRERCSATDGMLNFNFKFDIFITTSHLFVCRPTIELTIFEQQMCSTTEMIGNKQLQKKERSHFEQFEYTLNSAHHVKKQCNFVSS